MYNGHNIQRTHIMHSDIHESKFLRLCTGIQVFPVKLHVIEWMNDLHMQSNKLYQIESISLSSRWFIHGVDFNFRIECLTLCTIVQYTHTHTLYTIRIIIFRETKIELNASHFSFVIMSKWHFKWFKIA